MPPRALSPSGLFLVDKPAGPSSFQVIAAIRRRTRARTGHAGTLDPFATGLLLVLSGAATRLAPWLVGLDKRYVTDVDLGARTSTGDPEGEVVEESAPPGRVELEERLDGPPRRGRAAVPAASAVKIGGERAYRLHRRGETVEMPVRRSRVDVARAARVRGRRCAPRPARRVGHVRPLDRRRARRALPDSAAARGRAVLRRRRRRRADPAAGRGAAVPAGRRGRRRRGGGDPDGPAPSPGGRANAARRRAGRGRPGGDARVKVVRSVSELERKPRAVALGTFDGVHLGHRRVIEAAMAPGRRRPSSPSTRTRGACSATRVELLTRWSAASSCSPGSVWRRRSWSSSRWTRSGSRRRSSPRPSYGRSAPRSSSPARTSGSATGAGRPRPAARSRLRRPAGAAARGRVLLGDPAPAARGPRRRGRPPAGPSARGGRDRGRGRRTRGYARLPDCERRRRPRAARAVARHLRRVRRQVTGRRSRSGRTRTTAATSCGSRRSCSASPAICTASAW